MIRLFLTLALGGWVSLVFAQTDTLPMPEGLLIDGGFGVGRGFEPVGIFETVDGDEATVTGGGGAHFHLGLAYYSPFRAQFATQFGVAISELTPTLENAHATFRRFWITPEVRYPIPIKGVHYLTLGAGAGLYLGGRLYIDAQELAGVETYSRYATSFGPHFLAEYQNVSSERATVSFGLKGYSLRYTDPTTTLGETTVPSPYPTLNGGGIDFYIKFSVLPKGKKKATE